MNKADAIKEAIQDRNQESEEVFQQKVAARLRQINNLSKELRQAKKELKDMVYSAPVIAEDIADMDLL